MCSARWQCLHLWWRTSQSRVRRWLLRGQWPMREACQRCIVAWLTGSWLCYYLTWNYLSRKYLST
ncbi:hypothetical protein M441DRAFT_425607 [Trichoderma asperellum CBS 433.97]|uniref:Uncharacterized protein n=1 Tax=Trichoderma asperellum (strain ATCC 204424 / CBS 433.97 / NBRC 101777) TaxID=1042311 RepID=A0A2T3Z5E0_TRIA4|nr:hypothetical protein M441DRAFT_425607 [Trichoderma asperellum CBS 433.97]PTB40041.1 hypothetical protein M441DRAFT_425607 [Trichoderma asperellum CBS 433.97]